jgi:hypothetical protein
MVVVLGMTINYEKQFRALADRLALEASTSTTDAATPRGQIRALGRLPSARE